MAKTTYTAPVKKVSAAVMDFKNKKKKMMMAADKKVEKKKKEKGENEVTTIVRKKKNKGKRLKDLIKAQKGLGKEAKGIPFASFRRLLEQVMKEQASKFANADDFRIGKTAVNLLHAASEKCVTDLFKFANVTAVSNKRQTVQPHDFLPEVTRMFAKHIFEEEQCAEKAGRGLLNITKWLPQQFKKETDFDYVIGKRKRKQSDPTEKKRDEEPKEEPEEEPEEEPKEEPKEDDAEETEDENEEEDE
jgi:histone H3/H4